MLDATLWPPRPTHQRRVGAPHTPAATPAHRAPWISKGRSAQSTRGGGRPSIYGYPSTYGLPQLARPVESFFWRHLCWILPHRSSRALQPQPHMHFTQPSTIAPPLTSPPQGIRRVGCVASRRRPDNPLRPTAGRMPARGDRLFFCRGRRRCGPARRVHAAAAAVPGGAWQIVGRAAGAARAALAQTGVRPPGGAAEQERTARGRGRRSQGLGRALGVCARICAYDAYTRIRHGCACAACTVYAAGRLRSSVVDRAASRAPLAFF